jgi:hypothetical protein
MSLSFHDLAKRLDVWLVLKHTCYLDVIGLLVRNKEEFCSNGF